MVNNERLQWIDTAKGWGILLVIYGHLPYIPTGMDQWIYSFHMPLFVVLAGLVWKFKAEPIKLTLKKELKALMVPFVFFFALSWVFWLAKSMAMGREIIWWKPFVGAVLGMDGWFLLLENNAVLWFLPFLFSIKIGFSLLWKLPEFTRKIVFIVGVILSLLWLRFSPIPLPWSIDTSIAAWPFFALGYWLKNFLIQHPINAFKVRLLALSAMIAITLSVLTYYSFIPKMVWNGGRIQPEWIAYSAGLLGTLAVLIISFYYPLKFTSLIGRYSLPLFALHLPVYSILAAAWTIIAKRPPSAFDSTYYWVQFIFPLLIIPSLLLVNSTYRKFRQT